MTIITRLGRYGFILAAAYFVLLGGTYYYQIFGVRVFHHTITTLVLGAWLIVRLLRRRGLPPTPLNPLLYLCVIVWFASALVSLDPRMALENLWFPLTNLLFFFIMVDMLQSGRESLLVETQFLIAALVVLLAGVQLGSWFFGWGFATPRVGWNSVLGADMPLPLALPRLYVPLGVTTWLAAYTSPLIILAAAWAASARRLAARNALALLALLLLVVMLLTNSRGGWISLGVGSAVLVALQVAHNQRLQGVIRRYPALIGVGVLGVVAAGALALLVLSRSGEHAGGDILRFDLWRGALGIARDYPVLGAGPGLFGRAYRLIRDPAYVDNRLGTAHNVYLNTLAETGIVGAVIGVALVVVLLRSWWRMWRSADTPARRLHLEGALAALIGLGAQSFFDTFTSAPLVLLALGLTAYCVTPLRSHFDTRLKGNTPAAIVSLALLLAYFVGLNRSDTAQGNFIRSVGDSTDSLAQVQAALALDPALRLYPLQEAYLSANASDDPAAGIAAYQQALALEPTWDTGWINLAALYQRQGQTGQALDALQHAIDIDNRNGALLMWARLAESANAASPEAIRVAYQRYLSSLDPGRLPRSAFWTETNLRQQALESYLEQLAPDQRYRVLEAVDPTRLAALVPQNPTTAEEWWVKGEDALRNGDAQAALTAFSEAIARHANDTYLGDYYASRARAQPDPQAAARDLNIAELLGTFDEYPNAIRAQIASSIDDQRRLWAAAVPPRIIEQNFEGVLFGGRTASFDLLPEMRLPGPGHSVMQPWFDLAESYVADGDTDRAINVFRAILDRAPDEQQAADALRQLEGS